MVDVRHLRASDARSICIRATTAALIASIAAINKATNGQKCSGRANAARVDRAGDLGQFLGLLITQEEAGRCTSMRPETARIDGSRALAASTSAAS
jgi:hypothetical protein